MKRIWVFILVVSLVITSGTAMAESETKTYTGMWGVEYNVTFNKTSEYVTIDVYNPTNQSLPAHFEINVDALYSKWEHFELPPGERKSFVYDLTEGVNTVRNEHTLEFTAGQDSIWFNFTKDIDPETTEAYPKPEITDITIETTTFNGEKRSIINVSGHNPSGRYYTLTVRAFTFETSGYYGIIQFSPHNSTHETIILNEEPGELVAGEVRMYDGNFSSGEGAFDQVEIYGRSSGDTEWSHEKYQTVVPPWESDDHYVYTNESLHREKIGAPETLKESPIAWISAAVILLYAFRKLRKFRR